MHMRCDIRCTICADNVALILGGAQLLRFLLVEMIRHQTFFTNRALAFKIMLLSHSSQNDYFVDLLLNKTLGRALDLRANGTWLSKLTE